MYHLIHKTNLSNLRKILQCGTLSPIGKTGIESDWINEETLTYIDKERYDRLVFLSLLFPIKKVIKSYKYNNYSWIKSDEFSIYLVFDTKLLRDLEYQKLWRPDWCYGEYGKSCYIYNDNLMTNQNIELWLNNEKFELAKRIFRGEFSVIGDINNELTIEGDISLKYLRFIYVHTPPNRKIDWYSNIKEIEEIKKEYKQYEWKYLLPDIPFYTF
jgi:hypothetical protein